MSAALFERRGDVGIVTMNRPERLNAIGGTLLADLHRALVAAMADAAVGAVVLTGAGRAFCAGDDLKEFEIQTRDA
ncbi:MAG: enoyl-CoA hydratase-related protein, partial [Dongiaceae bacterium]